MDDQEPSPRRSAGGLQVRHLFVMVPLLAVAVFTAQDIRDNSFLWHVRAGTAQLDAQQVLTTDSFSYTQFGSAWRTQSWLVELGYGYFERLTGGVDWAIWMMFLVALVTYVLIAISVYRSNRSPLAVGLWMIPMVWLAGPFIQPRPVIFSFLFLAAVTLVLRVGRQIDWVLPLLIWIWAAVHGSWVIGLGLVILFAIAERSRRLAAVAALSVLTATLTAHGLGVWQIVFDFASNRDALALMQEWLPPEFLDVVQGPYLILLAGILVAAVRGKLAMKDLIVVIPLLVFGMSSRRTVFPAAIVLIPYAALAWVPQPRSSSRMAAPLVWGTAGAVALLVLLPLLVVEPGLDPKRFPSEEALAAVTDDRYFHDDATGGFLIYAHWPEQMVYLDDRAELYGAEMISEYQSARSGVYSELFARYEMTQALARSEWALVEALAADGWSEDYRDEYFVVLRAP